VKREERGITLNTLSITIISMSIVLLLALLKVYLSNQIYYKSKKINKLQIEVQALKEENNILKTNVQKLKYKNTILDTIFSMDENKKITNAPEGSEQ